jgi:branched-chain amino acid aminotransferase
MPGFFLYNGKWKDSADPVIGPDNRAFRYGDGLFETLRVCDGRIPLWNYHSHRIISGLHQLGFDLPRHFTASSLEASVLSLYRKNKHSGHARIRLSVFRGNGGLFDPETNRPQVIIQSWEIAPPTRELTDNGLHLALYREGVKPCDSLANLKSHNYLLYSVAARFAKTEKCHEALVLNHHGRVSDACTANIFWVRNQKLYTPPLSEGPVAGVLRRYLLDQAGSLGIPIQEEPLDLFYLDTADEILLTNAVQGIRWVKKYNERDYKGDMAKELHGMLVFPLLAGKS